MIYLLNRIMAALWVRLCFVQKGDLCDSEYISECHSGHVTVLYSISTLDGVQQSLGEGG